MWGAERAPAWLEWLRLTRGLVIAVTVPIVLLFGALVVFARSRPTVCSNDLSAWAMLQVISSAERQLRESGRIDVDGDGAGEYGTFAELSGAVPLPDGSVLNPPLLSGVFRMIDRDGCASRSGYRMRVFLPDASGDGVREPGLDLPPPRPRAEGEPCCSPSAPVGPPPPPRRGRERVTDRVDPSLASRKWCAYAWPAEYDRTGRLTFVVDQDGNTFQTDDPRYSGADGPLPGAAFAAGGALSIAGGIDPAGRGQDGNVWTRCR